MWVLVQEGVPGGGLGPGSVAGSAFGPGGKSVFLKISNTGL